MVRYCSHATEDGLTLQAFYKRWSKTADVLHKIAQNSMYAAEALLILQVCYRRCPTTAGIPAEDGLRLQACCRRQSETEACYRRWSKTVGIPIEDVPKLQACYRIQTLHILHNKWSGTADMLHETDTGKMLYEMLEAEYMLQEPGSDDS